jgi:rhomboid protease GluP
VRPTRISPESARERAPRAGTRLVLVDAMPGFSILALLALGGVALYFMTPAERLQLARSVIAGGRRVLGAAVESSPASKPFEQWLDARTGWPIVTPLALALSAGIFLMSLASGGGDATAAIVAWGGNIAPRTTNGEWWRLVSATFVHAGLLHLVATAFGLLPAGLILERAVGRAAFGAVFAASAVVSSVVSLWVVPATDAAAGASGAVFGVYGLLLPVAFWALKGDPRVPVPMIVAKRVAAGAAVFIFYNLATPHLCAASELAGFGTGLAGGLLFARGVAREKPARMRAAMAPAMAIGIAVLAAVPLRGVVDARPALARVAAVEERTTAAYDAAVARFRRGTLPAKALAQLIDRTIIPELQADRARLQTLRGVAREQAPLVAAAGKYFELREQSWRRRAEGLGKGNMAMLREADRTERAALDAFRKMQAR